MPFVTVCFFDGQGCGYADSYVDQCVADAQETGAVYVGVTEVEGAVLESKVSSPDQNADNTDFLGAYIQLIEYFLTKRCVELADFDFGVCRLNGGAQKIDPALLIAAPDRKCRLLGLFLS